MRPIAFLIFLVPLLSSGSIAVEQGRAPGRIRLSWCDQRMAGDGLNPERGRGAGPLGRGSAFRCGQATR